MNYQESILKVVDFVREIGNYLRQEQAKIHSDIVEKKGKHDFVTYVDKTSEQRIVERLKEILPEAGFIAEEGSESRINKPLMWIIDPLDGTTNYIHGMSPYAVSIALMHQEEIVGGVVYEVGLDECFYAWKNGGAFLNGKPISVSQQKDLEESLLATGFPYYDYSRLQNFMGSLSYFIQNTHGVRRLGTAATDLVYVACGRFEAFYEYGLSPWDVAAGAIIVKEAGGEVCDYSGGENYLFGKEIIASNRNIHDAFLTKVQHFLGA